MTTLLYRMNRRASDAAWRKRNLAAGLCSRCMAKRNLSSYLCDRHYANQRARQLAYWRRLHPGAKVYEPRRVRLDRTLGASLKAVRITPRPCVLKGNTTELVTQRLGEPRQLLRIGCQDFEVVFSGGEGLTRHTGGSSLQGVCA